MGKPCSCAQFIKSRIFYYKSRENPYQVLQVTCAASEHAMKSYDKIIITIVPSYTRLLPLALLLVLRTRNNTDGNKLVIFSGIALYYGDNYIIYSTSPLFLWQQMGIIFHIPTGSCKMMFPISNLVYSVNYFTCLLITYLVYSENYHVYLLIAIRTNQSGEYNR